MLYFHFLEEGLEEYALEELSEDNNIPLCTVLKIRMARRLDRWGNGLPKKLDDKDYDQTFRALVDKDDLVHEEQGCVAAAIVQCVTEKWPAEAGIEVARARYEWLVRLRIQNLDNAVTRTERSVQAAQAVLATGVSGPLVDALAERVAAIKLVFNAREQQKQICSNDDEINIPRPQTKVRGDVTLAVFLANIADELIEIEHTLQKHHCETRIQADIKKLKLYGETAITEQALATDLEVAQRWKIETELIVNARETLRQVRDRRLVKAANTTNPDTLTAARRLLKDGDEKEAAERVYRACIIAQLAKEDNWNGVADQLRQLPTPPHDDDPLFCSVSRIVSARKIVASVRRAFFSQQSPTSLVVLIAQAYQKISPTFLGSKNTHLCGTVLLICDLASRRLLSCKGGTTTYNILTWDLAAEALGGDLGSDHYTLNDLRIEWSQLEKLVDHFWEEGFQDALNDALHRAKPMIDPTAYAQLATSPPRINTDIYSPCASPLSSSSYSRGTKLSLTPEQRHVSSSPFMTTTKKRIIEKKKQSSASQRRAWIPPGTTIFGSNKI